jgi:hypothetical protein
MIMGKRLFTSPDNKRKLDSLTILIVPKFHAHIGIRRFVVFQSFRHFGNVACARGRER